MKHRQKTHHIIRAKILFFILLLLPVPSFSAEKSVEELAALGNEAFTRGDFDKAETLYEEALALKPAETALLYNRANVLYKKEKFEEALTLYREAIQKGPSRKLIGSTFFNAGNTLLMMARTKGEGEESIDELKSRLALYEQSFEMYRQALEAERALSIAEGGSVENAGLYARKNWALAREAWTETWEKIRALEKKNLKLEDGIAELLQVQTNTLPNLEKLYLNSLTEDILTFNLKRQSEYQKDYREDIIALKDLAVKEEEKIQAEIDNMSSSQPQQSGPADTSELQNNLQAAKEIKTAIEQAASLDEWIVDGLTRGKPIEAWQNISRMIGLLQDLSSFLKHNDPALSAYQTLLSELSSAAILLRQGEQLAAIEEKNEQVQTAIQRRSELAKAKNIAAKNTLSKINLYLEKMKETLDQTGENAEKPQSSATETNVEGNSDAHDFSNGSNDQERARIFKEAFAEAISISIDELLTKNRQILAGLEKEAGSGEGKNQAATVEELVEKAAKSFAWYKQLHITLDMSLTALIDNLDSLYDRPESLTKGDAEGLKALQKAHLLEGPGNEQMEIVLFQLKGMLSFLEKKSAKNITIRSTAENLGRQIDNLSTSWKNYTAIRADESDKKVALAELPPAADLFRDELLNTLLIFSPDTAINLSFARAQKLHENLTSLLPINTENSAAILGKHKIDSNQANKLKKLLENYFKDIEQSISGPENRERQEAYTEPLARRKNSTALIQRFIDLGAAGSSSIQEKKFQLAELLFKEMTDTLDKAKLSFLDQPDEGKKAISIAMELQKVLETQSRFANEAVTANGKSTQVNSFFAASQNDINRVVLRGEETLQQTIGMAEVPTHGGPPQGNQGGGQPDPEQLKKAIDKMEEAREQITINASFMEAGEFHNTFDKHPVIIALLQEALDLLENKDEKEGDDQKDDKQDKGEQEKEDQKSNQDQNSGGSQGESDPKKPLELSPSEARQLLEQLNKQDQRAQDASVPERKSFNTPRPW